MNTLQIIKALIVGAMILVGFGMAGHTVYWLLRYVKMGKKEARFDSIGERMRKFLVFVVGQRRVIFEFPGVLHAFIFWGFLILQVETVEYMIRGFAPHFHWSLIIGDSAYNGVLFLQDIFGVLILIAISIAAVRRYLLRPTHAVISMDAAVILALIGGLMVTKFFANGAEIALGNFAHDTSWTPVATFFSNLLAEGPRSSTSSGMSAFYHVNYFIHIGIVVFFANWIPRGKHLHLIGAMPNVFFQNFGNKMSALPAVDMDEASEKMMDEEAAETFYLGAKEVEDLTWKQLLDTYACTECGRCEAYCPAFNTGKALNPMMVIHNIKDALKEKGKVVLREGKAPEECELKPVNGGFVTPDELWACTTCGACVANCPVFIEHVNSIVDMRRYLAFNAEVPQELANTYRNIEQASNPWGMSNSRRGDWANTMEIPTLKALGRAPDVLFYVGCAGSFDDRQKRVSTAFAEILIEAGIDFAILGREEKCCGDTARRSGNEYLYWSLATENIETFKKYGVTKIVTTCPHGYNIIKNEYPQLGGHFEVMHHTEFIQELIELNKLSFKPGSHETITYHDSCYLGRWNQVYEAPRAVLSAIPGTQLVEMEKSHRTSMCCGAGGGRMWMEEDAGKRVNVERADQAIATACSTLAIACPFCMTMLDDGLKHRAKEEQIDALDIAEIVAKRMIKTKSQESSSSQSSEKAA